MKKDYSPLGQLLKDGRVAAGLTQAEVSAKLGHATPQYLSNCERGLCGLPLQAIRKLIDLYNLDQTQVLKILMDEQERIIKAQLFKKEVSRVKKAKA